jgi:hypothetical protein
MVTIMGEMVMKGARSVSTCYYVEAGRQNGKLERDSATTNKRKKRGEKKERELKKKTKGKVGPIVN